MNEMTVFLVATGQDLLYFLYLHQASVHLVQDNNTHLVQMKANERLTDSDLTLLTISY